MSWQNTKSDADLSNQHCKSKTLFSSSSFWPFLFLSQRNVNVFFSLGSNGLPYPLHVVWHTVCYKKCICVYLCSAQRLTQALSSEFETATCWCRTAELPTSGADVSNKWMGHRSVAHLVKKCQSSESACLIITGSCHPSFSSFKAQLHFLFTWLSCVVWDHTLLSPNLHVSPTLYFQQHVTKQLPTFHPTTWVDPLQITVIWSCTNLQSIFRLHVASLIEIQFFCVWIKVLEEFLFWSFIRGDLFTLLCVHLPTSCTWAFSCGVSQ